MRKFETVKECSDKLFSEQKELKYYYHVSTPEHVGVIAIVEAKDSRQAKRIMKSSLKKNNFEDVAREKMSAKRLDTNGDGLVWMYQEMI